MRTARAWLTLAAVAAVAACGELSGLSGLAFDGRGGAGEGGGPGVGGASSGSGGASVSSGAGQGGSGGSSTASGSSSASGASSSAASSASSTTGASSSSSSGSGGGSCTGDVPGVCCPDVTCNNGKCCLTSTETLVCGQNCGSGHHVLCDDSRDCPGTAICCVQYNGVTDVSDFQCQSSCPRPAFEGASGTYEVCSLANPACQQGTCHPSPVLTGGDYGYCF